MCGVSDTRSVQTCLKMHCLATHSSSRICPLGIGAAADSADAQGLAGGGGVAAGGAGGQVKLALGTSQMVSRLTVQLDGYQPHLRGSPAGQPRSVKLWACKHVLNMQSSGHFL